jgi:hypothetical protein
VSRRIRATRGKAVAEGILPFDGDAAQVRGRRQRDIGRRGADLQIAASLRAAKKLSGERS